MEQVELKISPIKKLCDMISARILRDKPNGWTPVTKIMSGDLHLFNGMTLKEIVEFLNKNIYTDFGVRVSIDNNSQPVVRYEPNK
jgi:hypothetical protein